MAKPVKFDEANTNLVAEGCGDLPVYKDGHGGYAQVISCWELSGDELMHVLRTKRIWLRVRGTTQPPLSLGAKNPFE